MSLHKAQDCELKRDVVPESIALFIDDQAFSPSYPIWLIPHPLPLSSQQVVSLAQSSCVLPVELTEELNHITARKPGPL